MNAQENVFPQLGIFCWKGNAIPGAIGLVHILSLYQYLMACVWVRILVLRGRLQVDLWNFT